MSSPTAPSPTASTNDEEKLDCKLNSSAAESQELALYLPTHHSRVISNAFRSPYTQTVLVGICAFCAPGIWNAITSTGAGGTLATTLVNGVDAFSLFLTATLCFAGPWVVNAVGFRWAMVIATYGYPLYSAALYYHQVTNQTWFLWFGTLLCGTSGGIFWACEPAIVMGYAEPRARGTHLAIWVSLTNLGGLVAGAINLGFNAKVTVRGSLSNITYIVLIALSATGPFWALLLSNPNQVRRSDGTPVEFKRGSLNLKVEARAWVRLVKEPLLLALFPLAFYVWLQGSYTGTYLALYFSVRARALGSFTNAILSVIFATLSGIWLDRTSVPIKTRARGLFVAFTSLGLAGWIWLLVNQAKYRRTLPVLDWSSPGFAVGFIPYLIQSAISQGILTGFVPWVIAELTEDHDDLFRGAALVRAISGYGSCVGYGLGAADKLGHLSFAAIMFVFFLATIPTPAIAVWSAGVGRKPIRPAHEHGAEAAATENEASHVIAAVVGGIPVHARPAGDAAVESQVAAHFV